MPAGVVFAAWAALVLVLVNGASRDHHERTIRAAVKRTPLTLYQVCACVRVLEGGERECVLVVRVRGVVRAGARLRVVHAGRAHDARCRVGWRIRNTCTGTRTRDSMRATPTT